MPSNPLDEIHHISSKKDVAESGGSHNQKGIEFQKHWAVMKMIDLEKSGTGDFLFLFETIQDVAYLDSATTPKAICICQVKKRDRKEWTWSDLTALHDTTKKKTKAKKLDGIKASPIGKLHAAITSFTSLESTGRFISNRGCDIALASGDNAATSLPSMLSELHPSHVSLLTSAISSISGSAPDLSKIHLEKVNLAIDDLGRHLTGIVHAFLKEVSPQHAGQAQSLAEALIAKIAPLGARTDTCKNFNELRDQRGFSRVEFQQALADLQKIPDRDSILDQILNTLAAQGMPLTDTMQIRLGVASIYQNKLAGHADDDDRRALAAICSAWFDKNPITAQILSDIEACHASLKSSFPKLRRREIISQIAIEVVNRCADQN